MIVVFDGVCNICNGWVQFLLKHDHAQQLRFASIQSATGADLLARHGYPIEGLDTLLFVVGERCYVRTDATLRVLDLLGGRWRILARAVRLIPGVVRDPTYRLLAVNRYRLFGKRSACMLPAPDAARRFLP